MKRNITAWILIVCMLVLLLSACGTPSATGSASGSTASPASAPAEETAQTSEPPAVETEASSAAEAPASEAEPAVEDSFAEGAGVWPIADGDKTITIWDGWFPFFSAFFEDYSETTFFQEMEKRTGVKTEFTLVNAELAAEQFNLMVATGDYCDLMHDVDTNYVGGLDTAYEEGVIIPIDDLIDTWMPNYKAELLSDEVFLDDLTSNLGNLYQFTILRHEGSLPDYGLMIRQDWLDRLDMERPQTYDQYYDVLSAFKNEMGASAPMMLSNAGSFQGNFFASGYGVNASLVNGSKPLFQVDGAVKFGPIEEGYKKYLKTMAKWYQDGLIYKDFYTYVDSNTMPPDDLVVNNQMGLFGANIQDIPTRYSSVVGENKDIVLVGAYDPVEKEGDVLHFGQDRGASATGGYCVSTACEDTELVARWADYIYSPEGQILSNFGIEGETFAYQEDGEPKLSDVVLHNPDIPDMLAITKFTTFNLVGVQNDLRMYAEFTDAQWEAGEIWSLGDDACTIPMGCQMTTEEATAFNAAYSDIATYVGQYALQAIMGDVDVDGSWEEYVANIQNMNIDGCIAQQQSALDRYYAD